jgi:hypothetical protein
MTIINFDPSKDMIPILKAAKIGDICLFPSGFAWEKVEYSEKSWMQV